MFDYLWIFHALYPICRMIYFCNILLTGCKVRGAGAPGAKSESASVLTLCSSCCTLKLSPFRNIICF